MEEKINSNGNKPRTEDEKEEIITRAAKVYGDYLTELGFDWQNDPNIS